MIPGHRTMAAPRSLKEDGQMCVCLHVLYTVYTVYFLMSSHRKTHLSPRRPGIVSCLKANITVHTVPVPTHAILVSY